MLDFLLTDRNLFIYSTLRSFSIRRTFWLRPRAKPEAAPGSLWPKYRRLSALISGPCHWLFTIYYWLLLCDLCGSPRDSLRRTKNAVSRRIFWNSFDFEEYISI